MSWAVAVAAAALATYAIRVGSVRVFGARTMPEWGSRTLRHAAIGLMAVLVVTALPDGGWRGWSPATVAGLAVATVIARRATNAAAIMGPAVAVYWVVGAIV